MSRSDSEGARFRIYRGFMRLQEKLELKVFAVVVKKDVMAQNADAQDPRLVAWEYMLQRLERFSTKTGNPLVLFHDEGESLMIRKATRRARRAVWREALSEPRFSSALRA